VRSFARRLDTLVLVGMVAAGLGCRRTPIAPEDAGGDGSATFGDAATFDMTPMPDVALDATPDAIVDASKDGPGDGAISGDVRLDAGSDAAGAVCPAGVAPLEVCGCGCCGGVKEGVVCYYPSRGETRDAIPNPMPSPQECATQGCVEGDLYVCCADPGPQTDAPAICAIDTSIEDLSLFTVTRRDGDVCTTLEVGGTTPVLPITGPPAAKNTTAWRGRCDGSTPREPAIGGLGTVTRATSGTSRYDVHVVLFFDSGTGIADAVRIDRDDVGVAPRCTAGACSACGDVCRLDATYSFTTIGGLALYRDATLLSPPATFMYVRRPEAAGGTDVSCTPPFPACGGAALDVADVMAAFADPDVQAAFAALTTTGQVPFYGQDQRGADGPAFKFGRVDDAASFLVGAPCPAASAGPCTPIPPGLTRLLSLMFALNQQQVADPSCAFARP
jgi:hypothetical protein